MDAWFKAGGCKERTIKCQKLAEKDDPDWRGNVPSVVDIFKSITVSRICTHEPKLY